jgi:hypothetical protein
MIMRPALVFLLVLLLSGCAAANAPPEATAIPDIQQETVSEDALADFLTLLETGDYHAIRRSGEEIFQEGLTIPNYRTVFEDYPFEELPDGEVRYDLLLIEGEGGVAWIYLFLERDTGRIIAFSAGEATF